MVNDFLNKDENRRVMDWLASGFYKGFVEWEAPDDHEKRSGAWKMGFILGLLAKMVIVMFVGAKHLPGIIA